jgi:hypothetical protein
LYISQISVCLNTQSCFYHMLHLIKMKSNKEFSSWRDSLWKASDYLYIKFRTGVSKHCPVSPKCCIREKMVNTRNVSWWSVPWWIHKGMFKCVKIYHLNLPCGVLELSLLRQVWDQYLNVS